MKIILNKIKEWKKLRKWYMKESFKSCKNKEWKNSDIWIKLLKAKTSGQCEKIIENDIKKEEIITISLFNCLFCKVWTIRGLKENNKNDYFILGKEKKPTIKQLKKMMKKNSHKEIELKSSIPMTGVYQPVAKIIR